MSKHTSSAETFLLSSAALANLTFMEPEVTGLMRRHGTVRVLVGAVRQQEAVSIYIQDQVRMRSGRGCKIVKIKVCALSLADKLLSAHQLLLMLFLD